MIRVQRRRGISLPAGVRYVGRPTRWGNPWVIRRRKTGDPPYVLDWNGDGTVLYASGHALVHAHEDAVEKYAAWIGEMTDGRADALAQWLDPLRGCAGLACWCPLHLPCHVDVLIRHLGEMP